MDESALKRILDASVSDLRRHFDVTAETNLMLRSGFAETLAMIRFSHAELDPCVGLLEEGRR